MSLASLNFTGAEATGAVDVVVIPTPPSGGCESGCVASMINVTTSDGRRFALQNVTFGDNGTLLIFL